MVQNLKDKIRHDLVSRYSSLVNKMPMDNSELRKAITDILESIVSTPRSDFSNEERDRIVRELVDEFAGFGPIEDLMKDPQVTEIMVNGPRRVYVERNGKKEISKVVFDSEEQVMSLAHKMLMFTRRRVDESFPYTDVSLKDGSRVNIIIFPVALDGPVITIQNF